MPTKYSEISSVSEQSNLFFSLQPEAIETERLKQRLLNAASGGYASFEGWVRNHNEDKQVLTLEYEAYPELAQKEGEKILMEAKEKFGVSRAACVHRIGLLAIGDIAVWVGVSSAHRKEAFAACQYIIDEVKQRLPIWKKETYTDGSSGWVNCQQCGHSGHAE